MTETQWYNGLSYQEKVSIKKRLNITVSDSSIESNDIEKMFQIIKPISKMKKILVAFVLIFFVACNNDNKDIKSKKIPKSEIKNYQHVDTLINAKDTTFIVWE